MPPGQLTPQDSSRTARACWQLEARALGRGGSLHPILVTPETSVQPAWRETWDKDGDRYQDEGHELGSRCGHLLWAKLPS